MNTQSQSTQSQSIQPIEVHIACILKDLQEMIRRIRAEGSRFTDTDVSSQSVPSPEKAHANPSKSVTYSARHPEAMRFRCQKKGSRSHGGKRSV